MTRIEEIEARPSDSSAINQGSEAVKDTAGEGGVAERKSQITAMITRWTPLAAHGVRLSLSFPSSGALRITHKKPILGTTKQFIEGLLVGAGLAPHYYGDYGPAGCDVPWIEWKGPKS